MVNKNLASVVPEPDEFSAEDTVLLDLADGLLPRVRAALRRVGDAPAVEAIWLMLRAANAISPRNRGCCKSQSEADQARFPAR